MAITAGYHTRAILDDGSVACWGEITGTIWVSVMGLGMNTGWISWSPLKLLLLVRAGQQSRFLLEKSTLASSLTMG